MRTTRTNTLRLLGCVVLLISCNATGKTARKPQAAATIWEAASRGDAGAVQRFLSSGLNVNARDPDGKTALHFAAQSKNLELVKLLIHDGADVNAKAFGNVTPLMLSVDMAFGQPDIALELVRAGADVSAADTNGDTALLIATTESTPAVMKAMLEKGANPNAQGLYKRTALHYAAMNAFIEQAQLLLRFGADPSIRDAGGQSSIDVAQTTNQDANVRQDFAKIRALLTAAAGQTKR
jgi:ankyrin repeat protein